MNTEIKSKIESAFYSVFPNSYISIRPGALSGKELYIKCYLQKPDEWENHISHNDPLNYMADINPKTMLWSEHNHSMLIKPQEKWLAYSSAKLRKRNIKNADIAKITKRFEQIKQFVSDNLDKAAHDIADKVMS